MMGSKSKVSFKPSEASSYFKASLIASMTTDVKRHILTGGPELIKKRQAKFLFDAVQSKHGVLPVAVFAVWHGSTEGQDLNSFQIVKYELNPDKHENTTFAGHSSGNLNWETIVIIRLQVEEIKTKCWSFLEILRKEPIASNEYVVVLYLISLLRDKVNLVVNRQRDQSTKVELPFVAVSRPGSTPIAGALEPLQIIHDIFRPTLEKLSANAFQVIRELSNSINANVFDENFPEIFDDLLYKINSYQGRMGGEYMQPIELSRFVCGLAGLPPNARVYNPFAGVGSLELFLDDGHNYLGQEINHTTWALGTLRMMAYGRVGNSMFLRGDSINNWNPCNEKYDLIVATPPFGMRLPKEVPGKFGTIKTCEHFLIEKGIDDLTPNGKLIAVIPHGLLFRGGVEKNLRKFLIENDLLEMVVSLPGGLLANTGIPIAVLVINRNKEIKGRVQLIEAKRFVDTTSTREKRLNDYALNSVIKNRKETDNSKDVSNTEISDSAFDYNVARYFAPKVEGVSLENLTSLIRGRRITTIKIGKFIRARDLKDVSMEYKLNPDTVENVDEPRQGQIIAESCLLLTTRWKTLKPTYFEYAGETISISTDIFALRVDETVVDVRFLINELKADYVNAQLESFRTGSIIPNIQVEDLLSIKIKLPATLEEQRAEVKKVIEALAEEKRKELRFFNRIHGLENEIVEQNTYLRHTLAGPTSNLKDALTNLKRIIVEKISPTMPGIAHLKVSSEHELTLGQYLDILQRDINKISSAVRWQLNVETHIESRLLTPVDIINWVAEFVREHSDKEGSNFEISFDFDDELFLDSTGQLKRTFILANIDLLSDLFENLTKNAVVHAFGNSKGKNRIEVYVETDTQNGTRNDIRILFSNTGKPFPKNFGVRDFVRKGSKAGVNAGDGFGGWYINEIIRRLNGKFIVIDEKNSSPGGSALKKLMLNDFQIEPFEVYNPDLTTTFQIDFPIIESEENEDV